DEQVAMEQEETYKIDQQVASLTEQYNDLMEEGRFAEAEVIAKQVGQLKPNSTIATLLYSNARMAKRDAEYVRTRNLRQDNFIDLMNAVDEAAIVPVEGQPMVFGDARTWSDLTDRRNRLSKAEEQGMSPAAAAIYEKLKQPVQVDFKARPLSEVVKILSDMTGILMHIDPTGLATEGLTPEQPVNLSLGSTQMISLRSALNLLLAPHNLDYRVQDEVLLITSARSTAAANYTRTYSVKDLVIPIPNFVSDYNSGLGGALRAAYETLGNGLAAKTLGGPAIGNPAAQYASASMDPNSSVLGQVMPGGAVGGLPGGLGGMFPWGNNGPISGSNPGFMQSGAVPIQSGAAPAKYDDLIALIQQTIDPDSWQSNGGSSTITPFAGNLSLVVSAPQTTHEKLADLLASLRRLQDLQVTIEVRFVTLNDNFFERMGVDFDFKLDDNARGLPPEDQGRSVTIGLNNNFGTTLAPTADLDLTFTQDSFTITPPFGGSTSSGANFGFAILSDIEMFFFLQAAQGDQRTSVLQAPRVTMFDGQQASINDSVQRPFVVSLIPVVGDFAVGQQPVIVVINEGTTLNVQAVVSQDKRFVRLTLNPTFSRIDRVETFTFQGTTSSNSGTAVIDPATGKPTTTRNDEETVTTGTTVQQPVFATTSVSTTVSVPDGGTILLGGIKRMSEGRVERGVPILSKIPYVNRLFKNTAIGRTTSTLMLTVTPRIIIQEEEEAILLGNTGP
ncbi:MAG: type II secretion system protein GspD, partial [Aureliella sp.]